MTRAGLIPTRLIPPSILDAAGIVTTGLTPGEDGATPSWASRAAAVATGALLTAAANRALGAPAREASWRPSGWTRSNYRGRSVSLAGGVAAALGAGGSATAFAPQDLRPPVALVVVAAGLAGAYDDLVAPRMELRGDKGWGGHVRALRSGRPSGGVVKVAVIGVAALGAGRMTTRSWAAAVPVAVLIAGTANLVNLFDLRPGRAGKVIAVLAGAQLSGPLAGPAAAVLGTALAELPGDLGETRMLGDVGANSLGALLGLRLAANGAPARWCALGVVTALTVASERVSFTEVIARYAPLRALDEWGRRPSDTRPSDTRPLP